MTRCQPKDVCHRQTADTQLLSEIALAGRRLDKLPYQVWVLCGDSEMAEGSMWEALDKAACYKLGNLTPIVDVNRLGQRGPTELEWDMAAGRGRGYTPGFGGGSCHAGKR